MLRTLDISISTLHIVPGRTKGAAPMAWLSRALPWVKEDVGEDASLIFSLHDLSISLHALIAFCKFFTPALCGISTFDLSTLLGCGQFTIRESLPAFRAALCLRVSDFSSLGGRPWRSAVPVPQEVPID